MNQRQAAQQVTEVAVWAREQATAAGEFHDHENPMHEWTDLADAADDLAAMIERDTFAATRG